MTASTATRGSPRARRRGATARTATTRLGSRRWDLFCRVIDNLGDIGVCWRLACQLAAAGQHVRLFCDDRSALSWMAPPASRPGSEDPPATGLRPPAPQPSGSPGTVQALPWPDDAQAAALQPAPVVIEAFGCNPPAPYVDTLGREAPGTAWINLEYLSAERYVERSHGLPSPQRNGMTKWFYYPGFTPATGGLLRERGLLGLRAAWGRAQRADWLARHGVVQRPGEQVVSLFCYRTAPVDRLIARWSQPGQPRRVLLLTAPVARDLALAGRLATASTDDQAAAGPDGVVAAGRVRWPGLAESSPLRLHALPWLSQTGFDRLLWSCDLNFVRGEDSLLRALWAGVPFVWQAYVQHDRAHHAKVDALLDHWRAPLQARMWWWAWNGMADADTMDTGAGLALAGALAGGEDDAPARGAGAAAHEPLGPDGQPAHGLPASPQLAHQGQWAQAVRRWRAEQVRQPALAESLLAFVAERQR